MIAKLSFFIVNDHLLGEWATLRVDGYNCLSKVRVNVIKSYDGNEEEEGLKSYLQQR